MPILHLSFFIFHFSFSPRARAQQPADAPAPATGAAAASAHGSGPAALPSGLDISSQVDRSEISIGDRILYEIKVVYPSEGKVELPSVLGNLGSFEVKDYQASDPKPAGKLVIQTWRFTLSTFTVGEYMIPPQMVVYLPPGAVMPANPGAPPEAPAPGSPQPLVFNTQPIGIKVVRTSPETVQDIADIAPLAPTPRTVPWLPIGIAAGALLAAGGWLAWRRRGRKAVAQAEKPPLPPYEEAMEALAQINSGNLIRQNRARELGFILSGILRRYVSRRFQVDALESTTTEFLALVPKLPVSAAQREWIGRFCESTDLVKFAGSPILESDGAGLVDGLRAFLNQTRPREVEGPPAGRAVPTAASPAVSARPPVPAPGPGAGGKSPAARKEGSP